MYNPNFLKPLDEGAQIKFSWHLFYCIKSFFLLIWIPKFHLLHLLKICLYKLYWIIYCQTSSKLDRHTTKSYNYSPNHTSAKKCRLEMLSYYPLLLSRLERRFRVSKFFFSSKIWRLIHPAEKKLDLYIYIIRFFLS